MESESESEAAGEEAAEELRFTQSWARESDDEQPLLPARTTEPEHDAPVDRALAQTETDRPPLQEVQCQPTGKRDGFRVLMASARAAWKSNQNPISKQPAAKPLQARNAFEAMMQAAVAPIQQGKNSNGGGTSKTSNGTRTDGRASRRQSRGRGRSAHLPSYKRIEGTRLVVDGFTAEPNPNLIYLLTHFHSDHYAGLSGKAPNPCSSVLMHLARASECCH